MVLQASVIGIQLPGITSIFSSLVKNARHQNNSEIEEIEQLLQDAESKPSYTANDALNLQLNRVVLESRLSAARQAAVRIRNVSMLADTTTTNCNTLLQQFGPIKEKSSQLLRSAAKIQSDATVTQAFAYTKEFAVGLLEISRDSLIDQVLIDKASMVKDEVIKEYGGAVPKEVQNLASEVSEKMSLIKTVPSIRT